MRIHSEYMTVQTKQKREFMNITPNVKAAVEKSGIRDGIILVSSLHSNSGVFVNDDEPGLLQDIAEWADRLAPFGARLSSQRAQREQRRRAPAEPSAQPPGLCLPHRWQARAGPLAAGDLRRTGRPAPKAHPHQDPRRMTPPGESVHRARAADSESLRLR